MKVGFVSLFPQGSPDGALRAAALTRTLSALGCDCESMPPDSAQSADVLVFSGPLPDGGLPHSAARQVGYALSLQDTLAAPAAFSHLSAADPRSAKLLCGEDGAVPVVLEPAALLTAEDWSACAAPAENSAPYLFADCPDRSGPLAPYIRALCARHGLSPRRKKAAEPALAEYIGLIRGADWVCTTSAAGAALCVLFQKPFFAALSPAALLCPETSPLFALLSALGLTGRIVGRGSTDALDAPIDYAAAAARLAEAREAALDFLRAALENVPQSAAQPPASKVGSPRLAPEHLCTGCTACASVCPKDAITMRRGQDGFSYPSVSAALCVGCGRCTRTCPLLQARVPAPLPAVFAAWNNDGAIRKDSTSGGAFTALAEYVLEGGGVVFGAALNGRQHLVHMACFRKEDLWRLRGAKYVQSDLGDVFREIKTLLESRSVLFSGTPCQVDGLYRYLGRRPENLITCDLVCHGVPSPGVWEDTARAIEARKGKGLRAVRFRNKVTGWKSSHFTTVYDDGTVDTAPLFRTGYGHAFGRALFLRPSCYRCAYTNLNRPGDFTLGDLWGLPDDEMPQQQKLGISLLLVNTAHASHIFDKLPLTRQAFPIERAVRGNPRLASPIQSPPDRADFFAAYALEPFDRVRKTFCTLPPLPVRIAGRLLSPEVKAKLRRALHK